MSKIYNELNNPLREKPEEKKPEVKP